MLTSHLGFTQKDPNIVDKPNPDNYIQHIFILNQPHYGKNKKPVYDTESECKYFVQLYNVKNNTKFQYLDNDSKTISKKRNIANKIIVWDGKECIPKTTKQPIPTIDKVFEYNLPKEEADGVIKELIYSVDNPTKLKIAKYLGESELKSFAFEEYFRGFSSIQEIIDALASSGYGNSDIAIQAASKIGLDRVKDAETFLLYAARFPYFHEELFKKNKL